MGTSESWDVNRHTARCTSLSVVWQCKLVSGWGLMKRRSAPPYGPYGSERTLLYCLCACVCVIEGSNGQAGVWIFLIAAGGAVVVAIVVVAGVLIQRTAKFRKQAKQLDDTNRSTPIGPLHTDRPPTCTQAPYIEGHRLSAGYEHRPIIGRLFVLVGLSKTTKNAFNCSSHWWQRGN